MRGVRRSPIERNPSVRFPTDFNLPIEVVRGLMMLRNVPSATRPQATAWKTESG